jgi:restriction system protein
MAKHDRMPKFHELMNPLLKALHELGGSGSIEEISSKVSESLHLPESTLSIPHDPEKSSQTEVEYRLAWARTYLKKYGLIDNSDRGVWVIVPEKREVTSVNSKEVVKTVREMNRKEREERRETEQSVEELPEEAETWRSRLHYVLTKELLPDAFERLVKRMLRESGFVQVEVTGRVGDGGIDGKGIIRVGGLLSFHVLFQCKKYQSSVSAGDIRDFRGALIGRADKGLFVTTGTFTRDAIREATRDGAPPIDLMDGDQLADKLKELRLGVKTEMVENVDIDLQWFKNI